jgi:hypothetical protein
LKSTTEALDITNEICERKEKKLTKALEDVEELSEQVTWQEEEIRKLKEEMSVI